MFPGISAKNATNAISIDFFKQKLQHVVYSKISLKINTFYSKKKLIFE